MKRESLWFILVVVLLVASATVVFGPGRVTAVFTGVVCMLVGNKAYFGQRRMSTIHPNELILVSSLPFLWGLTGYQMGKLVANYFLG
jgi:hypothetical protein